MKTFFSLLCCLLPFLSRGQNQQMLQAVIGQFAAAAPSGTPTPITNVYNANATWTFPAGLDHIVVRMWGGGGGGGGHAKGGGGGGGSSAFTAQGIQPLVAATGGGGGGSDGTPANYFGQGGQLANGGFGSAGDGSGSIGSGGGGGAYSIATIPAAQLYSTMSVYVGLGGAGGSGGGAGGSGYFAGGTGVSEYGGGSGAGSQVVGHSGTDNSAYPGFAGGGGGCIGTATVGSDGAPGSGTGNGGAGGGIYGGAGGSGGTVGGPGTVPGGGGGGGTTDVGGSAANGQVIVEEYYGGSASPAVNTNYFQVQITTTTSPQTFGVLLQNATNLSISWGDANTNTYTTAANISETHSYATAGIYTLMTWGSANEIAFYGGSATPALVTQILTPIAGISNITTCFQMFNTCPVAGAIPSHIFDLLTNCTSFAQTFDGCTALSGSIPNGLITHCPLVTTVNGIFAGAVGLSGAIPSDIFLSQSNCWDFSDAFYGQLSYVDGLTSFPDQMFQTTVKAANMTGLFYKNGGVANAIPWYFLTNCPLLTNFSFAFANAHGIPGGIPAHLFDTNTLLIDLSYTFHGNSMSGAIPANLLDFNTALINCSYTFNSAFTSIPSALFANCPHITTMAQCFAGAAITSIPSGLFDPLTACTTFNACFSTCTSLTTIPALLFANCTAVTDYSSCFYNDTALTGATPQDGSGTELWNLTGPPTGTHCFYNCTGLSDYSSIPAGWKGI